MKKIFLFFVCFLSIVITQQASVFSQEINTAYKYFIKDNIAYCTMDMFDREYIPCATHNTYSFSGQELIFDATETSRSLSILPLYISHSSEDSPAWMHFQAKREIICLDMYARESISCKIEFIERLDGSYFCKFGFERSGDCSTFPDFIDIVDGIPKTKGIYPVLLSDADSGSFIDSSKNISFSYQLGKEVEPIISGTGIEQSGVEISSISMPITSGKSETLDTKISSTVQSTCTLNGQSVDCAEMAETAGFWLKMGLWGFLIFGVLFLVGGIFWLMMLIHALSSPIPNKIMWVAVIFFISLVGAIIYYFVIKRKCVAVFVPPVVTQTVPNTSPVPTHQATQASAPVYPSPISTDNPTPVVASPTPVEPTSSTLISPLAPTVPANPPSSTVL